ncbi:MAG TPA: hypothetical protein VKF59_08935 [Candidatus Dormibacteraeota bacterium]|nr:hypothetical protein [Candidatus Dormibacteraeota bacterium]
MPRSERRGKRYATTLRIGSLANLAVLAARASGAPAPVPRGEAPARPDGVRRPLGVRPETVGRSQR